MLSMHFLINSLWARFSHRRKPRSGADSQPTGRSTGLQRRGHVVLHLVPRLLGGNEFLEHP